MTDLAANLAGKFLVLDGPDGSGKSTQLRLLTEHLAAAGAAVHPLADPGGTDLGDRIRRILLDHGTGPIAPMCETMLFMASRAQLVAEKIRPALAAGEVVLCDRFISATIAYQGASGVDPKLIVRVGEVAVEGLWPDLTVLLDLPADAGLDRAARRDARPDRMESRPADYHQAVRRNFLDLPAHYPSPVACIDAAGDEQAVFGKVLAAVKRAFPGREGQRD